MQAELDADTTAAREVRILGVNAPDLGDNEGMVDGPPPRVLPWLQDTQQAKVWDTWHVEWRDVVVLDGASQLVTVYNLTDHDLANPVYYAELKGILSAAAH